MFKRVALTAFLAMTACASAVAAERLTEAKPFTEQRQKIEAALANDKTYKVISLDDKDKILAALSRMGAKLGTDDDPKALLGVHKVEFFNDQELVNTLLAKADDDNRVICERYRPSGSKLPQNLCLTVAQRREQREQAATDMGALKRAEGAGR